MCSDPIVQKEEDSKLLNYSLVCGSELSGSKVLSDVHAYVEYYKISLQGSNQSTVSGLP